MGSMVSRVGSVVSFTLCSSFGPINGATLHYKVFKTSKPQPKDLKGHVKVIINSFQYGLLVFACLIPGHLPLQVSHQMVRRVHGRVNNYTMDTIKDTKLLIL